MYLIKSKYKFFLIFFVLLIGLLLRTVNLEQVPVSLTIDEVGVGYNAYSILKTGKDEWGEFMPLAFRSLQDYKSPLLIYSMIPAVWLMGLTEFSTRISTAIFGAFTILIVYFLINLLTKNFWISMISAFLVAISPWHIRPSRMSYDGVLALLLVLIGILIFLKSVLGKKSYLWISSIFFGLSMIAYHSEKVFTPLIILALCLTFRSELLANKKRLFLTMVVGFLSIIPMIMTILSPSGLTRANMTFFSRDYEINRFLHKSGENLGLERVLDDNVILLFNFWAKRYLDYFDFNFLFFNGMGFTIPNSPDLGLLHLFELPFFFIGVYTLLLRGRIIDKKIRLLIFLWLLIGPFAASLSNNYKHDLRNLTLIPMFQLFSATGIWVLFQQIRKIKYKFIFGSVLIVTILWNIAYFINLYFVNYQYTYSEHMMDGWKKAAIFALENQTKYREIVVDPRFGTLGPETVGVPYLYILFYGNVPPEEYQNDVGRKKAYDSANFRNFVFREINWPIDSQSGKETLFIGSKWVLPAQEEEILTKFHLLNGKEVLRAATPK